MRYAKDVMGDVLQFRLAKMGFGNAERFTRIDAAYELKSHPDSSHAKLHSWLQTRRPRTILDLGCSDGQFAERLRGTGSSVVGVDISEQEGVAERVDQFIRADLDQGIPD